ncbi:bifunctional pyr operon transcriptional regulator/uracil phosphoribosyltransferase PyrR [bacterium]
MKKFNGSKYKEKKLIMDSKEMMRTVRRMVHEIIEKSHGIKDLIIIGLQTRGVYIAEKIAREIKKTEGRKVSTGVLDFSLYRDDLSNLKKHLDIKETKFPFEIDNKKILIVDDVLFTGRSARAAIECIMDFGRPKNIKLAVLIDRGHRELPIQPDFIGKKFVTTLNELIAVQLKETDKKERVVLLEKVKG